MNSKLFPVSPRRHGNGRGNGRVFSCQGIQIVVDYFKARGHDHIKVFVPEWRKEQSRPDSVIIDQHVLTSLESENILVFTPSRKVSGRRIVCYDDRYIIRYAHMEGGVIVSNDQFRDLMQENPEWRKVIEERLLQFTFVNDHFMPPDDPLGKCGPTLDQLLYKDPRDLQRAPKKLDAQNSSSLKVCPHLGNCTFGRKCKYYHPDREPQKLEHATGSGSSGGSYTPSTMSSSRSTTPSPSPDGRVQGGGLYSSRNSREDLHNRYNSSDDLHRVPSSGEIVVSPPYPGGGSSPYSPATVGGGGGGIDISEVSKKLVVVYNQTSPTKGPAYNAPDSAYNNLDHAYHQPHPSHTGPQLRFNKEISRHVHSAPAFETTPTGLPLVRNGLQNHTFPITQVPRVGHSVRGSPNVSEDQSYLKNRAGPDGSMTFGPRETGPSGGSFPSSRLHDIPTNNQYLPQGQYGGNIGGGMYPSNGPPPHQGADYRGRVGYQSQSIPLHTLQQHFSPSHQPHPSSHPYAHAPPPPPPPPANLPHSHYPEGSYNMVPRITGGEGFPPPDSRRLELFRMVSSVLRGCEDRILRVMQHHPELASPSDMQRLVELVKSD